MHPPAARFGKSRFVSTKAARNDITLFGQCSTVTDRCERKPYASAMEPRPTLTAHVFDFGIAPATMDDIRCKKSPALRRASRRAQGI